MHDDWASLPALERHLWDRLDRSVQDADDPWRLVTLATVGASGPQARTVALRGADRRGGTVEMHTDARTPKVAELRAAPRAQVMLWDGATQEQLRLSVRVEIVEADPDRWEKVPDGARGNYGTEPVPGTPISGPEDYVRAGAASKFAALVGRVEAMDAVLLASDPHRRAMWDGAEGWRWTAP